MMSDLSQESLLREIDEDIRRERFAKLWKRYGTYVIGEAAEQFTAAVALASKDRVAAEERLRAIAKDGPSGYGLLAAFQQAALLAKSGDRQAARNAYQDLQRSASDPIYRDLAILSEAMVALGGEALPIDADAIRNKLQPLTLDGNSWRFSARELTAVLAWRGGQTSEAKEQLNALAADPQTPADIRDRAQQMLAQIGQV